MAHAAAPPLSPPLTFRNKKRRIQWDMGDYQHSMTSESGAPLFSAPDSQRMMSYGNPAFPDILGFDDTLLNGEVQLQNDIPGVLPITSSSESPYGLIAADIPYPGGINAPVAPELNLNSEQQSGFNLNNRNNQIKQYKRRKSHNIVERRYRVNLNAKFRKLEEVVLQGTASPSPSSPSSSQQTPSPRRPSSPQKTRSKARVLDGALSYIESLESEISSLKEAMDVSKD